MRETCASGSVGGEGGNALAYPAPTAAVRHRQLVHCERHSLCIPAAPNKAGFAERSVMEFSGDHSARRHMHLEIRGSPFAILPPNEPKLGFPVVPKRPVAFRLSCKRSPDQMIRRPAMRL
jgi:hypothetical protein